MKKERIEGLEIYATGWLRDKKIKSSPDEITEVIKNIASFFPDDDFSRYVTQR